jgi:hypothetical protein
MTFSVLALFTAGIVVVYEVRDRSSATADATSAAHHRKHMYITHTCAQVGSRGRHSTPMTCCAAGFVVVHVVQDSNTHVRPEQPMVLLYGQASIGFAAVHYGSMLGFICCTMGCVLSVCWIMRHYLYPST